MADSNVSIIPMIEVNYQKLSPAERRVADFFISNRDDSADLSAHTISEKLFISEPTLSRFAKKCGFKGYREFAYRYKNQTLKPRQSVTCSVKKVLSVYDDLLDKEYNLIDEKQIDRIVDYIGKYERVMICGKGSSGFAAEEMEIRLMRVGVNVDSVVNSDRMRMQSVFMDKKCLVIGMSMSGTAKDVLYMLEMAHKNGAKTVLITSYRNERNESFCDEVVLVPATNRMDQGNSISPQFPFLVVSDIIYTKYMEQNQYMKETLHDSTLKALGMEDNDEIIYSKGL
ncbi:RpiR family transcriptional regulator [Oribacterium sp. C9]|uniref:MurR/RpiR family transcriptional regulator n=1 Tax=Oribacterium sp. C9 TaxID=1943579 RepID=UPI00098F6CC1|nr:MurR/RpiR family transcriptional regulator [Oribacterium sp. C9]OON86811.1 RpiR family transcriptional regulator [Oribacterium sp. C9]